MENNLASGFTERKSNLILWTVLLLMPIVGMAIDLVAPSLPAISLGLHVSTHAVKNLISIYLLGYALGNFYTGFLTDAWGRQKLLRVNLLAFVVISLIPVFFPQIDVLLLVRLLQGLTIGAVAVLVRVIASDVLPAEKIVRLGTLIGTMWGLGPVIGPILGGYLQAYFGWKAGFYFFAGVGLLGFIAVWLVVPETYLHRKPLQITTIRKNLAEVFSNKSFIAIVILMGLAYSLVVVFNTMGPFLIQSKFQYSPVFFGRLALCLGTMFLFSTFFCRYLLKKFPVKKLFFLVINLSLAITCMLFVITFFLKDSIVLTALASAGMFFTCGFLFPMSMGQGLSLFRHIAGTASATMYLVNISLTSLLSLIVSFVTVQSFLSLMSIYLFLMFACAGIYWGIIHKTE